MWGREEESDPMAQNPRVFRNHTEPPPAIPVPPWGPKTPADQSACQAFAVPRVCRQHGVRVSPGSVTHRGLSGLWHCSPWLPGTQV